MLGARPQFIKASSVNREIAHRQSLGFDVSEVIVHTGQHYDVNMSDIFFDEMRIPKPSYNLGIRANTHGSMTGQMIAKIEEILIKEQPDWVMVYGDTNSTLAGAIAASKLNIDIAHVEAGLRSFNMNMPEEVNRILTDRISKLLFCPTQSAVDNLYNEGVGKWQMNEKVVLSGDVMHDAALFFQDFARKPNNFQISNDFVLCTVHRAENTDDSNRLKNIVSALNEIAQVKQVVLPLHPRTKKFLQSGAFDTENLTIIDPLGYLNMVWLINHCCLVVTDSGGLQKEAYYYGKPCLITRDQTEWGELLEVGTNILVGANKRDIISGYNRIPFDAELLNIKRNIHGSGNASKKIVAELLGR